MSATELASQCQRLATLFRLGMHTQGAMDMLSTLEALPAVVPAEHAPMLAQYLQQMLDCQQHQDWLGLADYFEFELMALLKS